MHQVARRLAPVHDITVGSLWDSNRSDWLLGTTLRASPRPREYTIEGIRVHRIGLSAAEKRRLLPAVIGYYAAQGPAIRTIARVQSTHLDDLAPQADLVHNGRIGREPFSFASQLVARRKDVPFVLTPYHHPRWQGWWYRHFLDLYIQADALIALTNSEKETLGKLGARLDRVFVTGMGPVLAEPGDPQGFRDRHDLSGPVVLFLGQHYPYKGYRQLLAAAHLVWKRIPETSFVFIGPAVGRSEDDFRGIGDKRIVRLGTVDLSTKTAALAACDVLCVPSTQESFGGVYTEAWMFEKPVIGCSIPAVREIIEDGVDGFLVAQEARQIAERICYLLMTPGHARQIGRAGKRKVEAHFTWEKIAARTEAAYRSVLTGTSP
jgi:glycosyltransferase involved in cell wall biosynthesis